MGALKLELAKPRPRDQLNIKHKKKRCVGFIYHFVHNSKLAEALAVQLGSLMSCWRCCIVNRQHWGAHESLFFLYVTKTNSIVDERLLRDKLKMLAKTNKQYINSFTSFHFCQSKYKQPLFLIL